MIQFESRWETLESGKGFQRVDEEHPLDFYLGLDISGERVLLLVADNEVGVPVQTRAIQVLCRQRHDGKWALMFRLIGEELNKLFSHLCEDIVEYGRNLPPGTNPADAILMRFMRWQRLLERTNGGLLDESAIRGLVGELIFLENFTLPDYGAIPAIEGWVGPLDAEQDFRYPNIIFEVKTIRPGSVKVKISSAEQLEESDLPLHLVTVTLNSVASGVEFAFCITDIVNQLRTKLEFFPAACKLFEERLLSAGYLDRDEYKSFLYSLGEIRQYEVRDGFPRIMRSQLSNGIGSVKYEVELADCQPFEIIQEGNK